MAFFSRSAVRMINRMWSLKRCALLAVSVFPTVLLTSCMVGPDFHSPKAPRFKKYTSSPLPAKTVRTAHGGKAGKAQYFVSAKEIPAEWWKLFRSPEIDQLIRAGLANSPNLEAAQATLRQAQETLRVQIGNLLFPAFGATVSGERQRFPAASFGESTPDSIFNTFNATVNVTYTLDVFGGARRQIESQLAQVDFNNFNC